MEREPGSGVNKPQLLSAIATLSEKIARAVQKAKEDFKASPDVYDFLDIKNPDPRTQTLFLVPPYVECFKSLGVSTRAELEQLWAREYSDPEVREKVEELLETEESIREFATEVDKVLISHERAANTPACVGQSLPKDLLLTDAETGEQVALEMYWKRSKFTWFVFLRHFG